MQPKGPLSMLFPTGWGWENLEDGAAAQSDGVLCVLQMRWPVFPSSKKFKIYTLVIARQARPAHEQV